MARNFKMAGWKCAGREWPAARLDWNEFELRQSIFLRAGTAEGFCRIISLFPPCAHSVRKPIARVVELVDASDSKSDPARGAGSIPASGTKTLTALYIAIHQ